MAEVEREHSLNQLYLNKLYQKEHASLDDEIDRVVQIQMIFQRMSFILISVLFSANQ